MSIKLEFITFIDNDYGELREWGTRDGFGLKKVEWRTSTVG
jgi:hypothetical protein